MVESVISIVDIVGIVFPDNHLNTIFWKENNCIATRYCGMVKNCISAARPGR